MLCLKIKGFSIYQLDKPRDNLIIFDQYELHCLNTDVSGEIVSQKYSFLFVSGFLKFYAIFTGKERNISLFSC